LKDRSGAEREALRLAVEDARKRADASASGAGMTVERVLRIEEQRATVVPPPRPMMMESRAAAAGDTAPPVAPGELEIRASVKVVAAIR
ncbi:MAG: SIMPL domain-containing protein, partial [Vicinamibacterales bacterium]